jgi:hypothetical protein
MGKPSGKSSNLGKASKHLLKFPNGSKVKFGKVKDKFKGSKHPLDGGGEKKLIDMYQQAVKNGETNAFDPSKPKVVVLNETQMKNPKMLKHFKSAGFKVVQNAPIPPKPGEATMVYLDEVMALMDGMGMELKGDSGDQWAMGFNNAVSIIKDQISHLNNGPEILPSNSPKPGEAWEKRFDEEFPELTEEIFNNGWAKRREVKWIWVDRKKEVKAFISDLLAQQRQELSEKYATAGGEMFNMALETAQGEAKSHQRNELIAEVGKMRVDWSAKEAMRFSTNPVDSYTFQFAHNQVVDAVLALLNQVQ